MLFCSWKAVNLQKFGQKTTYFGVVRFPLIWQFNLFRIFRCLFECAQIWQGSHFDILHSLCSHQRRATRDPLPLLFDFILFADFLHLFWRMFSLWIPPRTQNSTSKNPVNSKPNRTSFSIIHWPTEDKGSPPLRCFRHWSTTWRSSKRIRR